MTKLQKTMALYYDTSKQISSTPGEWISFLDTAATNYKYSFDEQVLIYAQRPDATACAEIETWNRLGRRVKAGSKGIALITEANGRPILRYVFDIADTNDRDGRKTAPWQMHPEYDSSVIKALESRFGELKEKETIANAMISAASNAVEDNTQEYLSKLLTVRQDSFLEELDEHNVEVEFNNILCNSVAYMTMKRCGIDPSEYFGIDDFRGITQFNSLDTMARIGSATSDITESGLREIYSAIRNVQAQVKKSEYMFANISDVRYTNDKNNENPERSFENGIDIHENRRLLSARPDHSGTAGRNSREIRNDEAEISQRTRQGTLHGSDDEMYLDGAFGGSRTIRNESDGTADKADGEGTVRDRGTESDRSNEMGRDDEQHPSLSGGNHPERTDIQLDITENNIAKDIKGLEIQNSLQMSFFDIPDLGAGNTEDYDQISFFKGFEISQQVIDEALCLGGNEPNSLERICAYFAKDYPLNQNVDFLKEEYRRDGKGFYTNNRLISVWFDKNGIRISEGKTASGSRATVLTWEDMAKRIRELLDMGRYVPQEVFDRAEPNERQELSEKLWYLVQHFSSEAQDAGFLPTVQEVYNSHKGFPEESKKLAEQLKDPLIVDNLSHELTDFVREYERNRDLLRFHYHKPANLLEQIQGLQRVQLNFSVQDSFAFEPQQFITNDEIDKLLIGGSNVNQSKFRIYSYFIQDHTAKERADFLKNEYGDGGSGRSGFNEWHDSRGICYSREDNMFRPYDKVLLPWNKVEKRIGELIHQGRYMTDEELAYIPTYEKNEIARSVYHFFSGISEDTPRPYHSSLDFWDSVKYIGEQLDDAAKVEEIYQKMLPVWESTTQDNHKYSFRQKAFEDMTAFRNGTFTLFNEHKEPRAISVTVEDEPVKKEIPELDNTQVETDPSADQEQTVDEKVDTEKELLTEDNTELTPVWEHKKKESVAPAILLPEVKQADRHNYRITDDVLGVGGSKEKYRNNIAAINTLHEIERDGRFATPEEQEILSKYVGWGGLSDAFDQNKPSWTNEYNELRTTLSPEEYAAARESTLTAFYTPPVVIRAMYTALENMGFKTGNILEPSCGTGNFIGMLPDSMDNSKVYGVELDSISGRIAQQLYQKSSITVQGFEKTDLPDSFFDCAIGNVPFGQFKVADKRYDKQNFLIHDYFFAKTLDKVRPGGIIAFVTSKGTLDKKNSEVRKYIAQRADLLGAIRLPDNTFKANAGTEVTADIIFLQKRERPIVCDPSWLYYGSDDNNVYVNNYYIDNPHMLLGRMVWEDTQFGQDTACKPFENANLGDLLNDAISNIHGKVTEYKLDGALKEKEDLTIPADPSVRNYSYAVVDGNVYYRENSRMIPQELSDTASNRIKSMIEIRNCVRTLIELQTEDYPDQRIKAEQDKLNRLYDNFSKTYGLINSRANNMAFSKDSSYFLLCSLEIINENGELVRKADMFTKRTIKPHTKVTSVDTASEALVISISEKARIDIDFMCQLTGKTANEIETDLNGVIFRDLGDTTPENIPKNFFELEKCPFVTADEYLSGNVRMKLKLAQGIADMRPDIADKLIANITALEQVQPQDLKASEISVRLGATWLPTKDVKEFMFKLLDTPSGSQSDIDVRYSELTSEWNISGKNADRSNVKSYSTYGTSRVNAYKIIEDTLNLRDIRIFDYVEDEKGNRVAVLNKKETAIAQGKQQLIKNEFSNWIWSDQERRERLTRLYNDKFNSIRPREYDGSHITFNGINTEITLRPHQVNAIAHVLYGGNTLLAHVVGAGKTYEMVAAAQESKRLGLCNKSLFVVPNHLTEQWASEYLQLYPSANILVATKKDFETKNRKKFCARIATGDYDAVIIGHSQFEKIPISVERQQATLQQQIDEITWGITDLKRNRGENFTIKQLEKTKKSIQLKLDKLNDQSRKDDVVTFEELGVDRLFVDEAHSYKNLFLYTKMRNVGGIAQTEAQKSTDLFMKCRYLDELTGNKGVVFATGTPISNSMTELYTMQRYLQYDTLQQNGLQHFDAWASTFGETVTAIELSPEGTGYRAKTRFAKFFNLPELMVMFKEIADIQTADMLNLPVPKANYHNVVVEPSEIQRGMVAELADRAERVRKKMVDSNVDNMLLITNDGRKLALDQRLMNPLLPDEAAGKVAACSNTIFECWEKTKPQKSTQLVFCDLSTPHHDGKFNVYDDIKEKLVSKGIPNEEIAYIHDANTEAQKKELFAKVRNGKVRVLIGSTAKMGAGTNVQDRLIASHDLDCPWRPSDLEQRSGRTIRQGNQNPEVHLFRYVTEGTFDAYLYQLVENKQRFISQIMTSKTPVRSAEDVDEAALSYAEIKALATGNPMIIERCSLENEVNQLKLLKSNHLSQQYDLEDRIAKSFPQNIKRLEVYIAGYKKDIQNRDTNTVSGDKFTPMIIGGITYTEKADAGKAILKKCKEMTNPDPVSIGRYRGFEMKLSFISWNKEYEIALKGSLQYSIQLGSDIHGNITRLDNVLSQFETRLAEARAQLTDTKRQFETAKIEVTKPFPQDQELVEKSERLSELDALLKLDEKENEIMDNNLEQTAKEVMEPKKPVQQNTINNMTKEQLQDAYDTILDYGAAETEEGRKSLDELKAALETTKQQSKYISNADIASGNSNGFTPLHRAAFLGDDDTVRELLKSGIYVDTRDNLGYTPLRYAAQSGNEDTVNVLLQHGADAKIAGIEKTTEQEQVENIEQTRKTGRSR